MKAGQKIRKIRDLKGFSQEYMALRLNMSQTNYSKIESDEVKLTLDRLMEIGDIFGMDPLDILSFDKELIFNNHDQKGGQAGNIIIQNVSENERALYEQQIKHLQEEIQFLRAQLDKKQG